MKIRVNAEYCIRCGGLRSYQEDDPTLPALTLGAPRIEVYPEPLNVTGPAPTVIERICGCRSKPVA